RLPTVSVVPDGHSLSCTEWTPRVIISLADEFLGPSAIPKERLQHSFPIRVEDHAAHSAIGSRLCRFSFLRHMGANVRHEERRRNAGTKHRLRCRWKDLQPPRRRQSSQGFAE